MKKSKIFIFELNEISPLILEKYIKAFPNSSISKFTKTALNITTIADDVDEKKLYPAQSWASINSGKPYKLHKVKWYNDTKKNCSHLWDDLSVNHSIGLVNVLHSSDYKNKSSFNYFISDPYKKIKKTIPSSLNGFQRFKNNQTFKSNRVSKLKITFKELKDILTFIFKIRSITYLRILKILFDFKFNKKRERLRNVDFLLHFDIFLWALKNKESKINVFYTNHIASQIHRYIGALLPNKTIRKIFGQKWIKKNSNEVFYSINLFEKNFKEFKKKNCNQNDTIVFVSSMGQGLVKNYDNEHYIKYVSDKKIFFKRYLNNEFNYQILGSMSPQLTIKMKNVNEIKRALKELKKNDNSKVIRHLNYIKNILTITVSFENLDFVIIRKKKYSLKNIGVSMSIEDKQNTGNHIKEGIFLINSPMQRKINLKNKISYLKYRKIMQTLIENL
jgi:hypothetical protein